MRKTVLENNNYYHIYNRGVDKRNIFNDDKDYIRFITELNYFNTDKKVINFGRDAKLDRGSTSIKENLVRVECFCLMPNHYHLILKQLADNGIVNFMQKLGTGYTMYFNKKYRRSGSLFEGRYKSKLIEKDEYIVHLSRYIHQNPVKLIQPDYQEVGFKDKTKIEEFLKSYRWSSCQTFLGIKDTNTGFMKNSFIMEYFKNNHEKYRKFLLE